MRLIQSVAQEAGVDAFIVQDVAVTQWDDITVPLHASTQCAIRTPEDARFYESLGFSRLVIERETSMETLREIRKAVGCELEFFVHGALCVCYSGECRLSEYLDGRSADRGECIQACRSLYDLEDASGKVLVRDKALLSMRDFKLLDRLEDLAEAGICSFKIEGRLKNASYVKNVVREYSLALDALVQKYPERYRRASFGQVSGGFKPDSNRTFNRGYTTWWLDGKRGRWSAMDSANGEYIGEIQSVKPSGSGLVLDIRPAGGGLSLANGDGFAFTSRGGTVVGFRGDRCEGTRIWCKRIEGLRPGVKLWRNISAAFEREVEASHPRREILVDVDVKVSGSFVVELRAASEDGRSALSRFNADVERAENRERAAAMLQEQLSKRSGEYLFRVRSLDAAGPLPLLSASTINSMRRLLAEDLASGEVQAIPLSKTGRGRVATFSESGTPAEGFAAEPLMRTRYCVRYELGMCPKYQGAKPSGPLFLVNNGRRLALGFDCARCEMTVTAPDRSQSRPKGGSAESV